MTTILSSPTTVTVSPPPAPGTPALGPLAASMAPGTWAQLTVSNQNALLGVGGSTSSMVPYCNTMPWNPLNKSIEIIGQDHGYPQLRHVRYDEANNQFVLVADDAGLGPAHGYDHNVVNPFTGDLYHRRYSYATFTLRVHRKSFGSSTFVQIPTVSVFETIATGACWWSGSFTGGSGGGAQGVFMNWDTGNSNTSATDGTIVAFNPLTNTWVYNQTGRSPFYGTNSTYSGVMEYSAVKNVAVYGGGNAAPTRLWRLNSDGTFVAMPNTPGSTTVGVQKGILVNEPVSGNFLLLSNGQLWELNPSGTGVWTQQTGARVPPSGVGNPTALANMFATAIADYGVVAFVTQPQSINGTFYLYKHA